MEDEDKHTLENYSKNIISEPNTYSILLEKKKLSTLSKKDLDDSYLNSHTVIKDSNLTVNQLLTHLSQSGFNNKDIKLFDVGCGLGFISNEIAKNLGYNNVYCADPSPSTKDFINLEFPELNFIYCDIANIPDKFNGFFDIVYLREVYPFTRTNNIEIHKKLLKKLFAITKKNGMVILEQIKTENNIFNNLKKLDYEYNIKRIIPNRLLKNKIFLLLENLNYNFANVLLFFLYKIKKSQPCYYINFVKS